MGEAKRKKTIGEEIGLKPLEPMVLKIFNGPGLLQAALRFDEDAVTALRAVGEIATSPKPPDCLICRIPVMLPMMGMTARTASNSPVGVVAMICPSCANSDTHKREGDVDRS